MFHSIPDMLDFIEQLRNIGGKPVGIKLVVGHKEDIEELALYEKSGKHPDFITVDGGEGGTGASFHELADSAGLPIFTALPMVHQILKKYGVRDQLKLFASGKLLSLIKSPLPFPWEQIL